MSNVARAKKLKPRGQRIFFDSPAALRRYLTPRKLDLIRLIREQHPVSINALATLAHRDFKRVYEDVNSLAEAGLVDLTKEKGRKKTPWVADELRLEIVV